METTDRLCIIPPSEWTELRDLYRQNWPEHRLAYDMIDNCIKWYNEDSALGFHRKRPIFCLNGSWREDGTYLVNFAHKLFIYSLDPTNCILEKALHLLDWSGGFERVVTFLSRHREPFLKVITAKGLEKEYDSETIVYNLPKAECDALELELYVPEGFELRSLSSEDLAIVNHFWPNRHQDSVFFVERRGLNWNVGLFECSTGKLVAWCFDIFAGLVGGFKVHSEYLRRGFETAVAIVVAKSAASLGQDCYATVNRTDVPWKRMLERIGFKDEGTSIWYKNLTVPSEWECGILSFTKTYIDF